MVNLIEKVRILGNMEDDEWRDYLKKSWPFFKTALKYVLACLIFLIGVRIFVFVVLTAIIK